MKNILVTLIHIGIVYIFYFALFMISSTACGVDFLNGGRVLCAIIAIATGITYKSEVKISTEEEKEE